MIEGLRELLRSVIGAISMVALIGDQMVAVRDPRGIRPLSFSGSKIASESSALGPDADDVPPGHAVVFPGNRVIEVLNLGSSICALEFVYFARPESVIGGRLVYDIRYRLGEALAEEEFASIDAVTYIPETARIAALGYSNRLGRPIIDAIQKNRYIGRVFIKPPDARRSIDAFHIVPIVKGLRIAVIDDSLIRGTNIRRIVSALKAAGAREVHVRIASPPIKWPCFMGMDFQSRDELIAHNRSVDEVAKVIGADSVHYLSLTKFREIVGPACYACFTGEYPVKIDVEWAEARLGRRAK